MADSEHPLQLPLAKGESHPPPAPGGKVSTAMDLPSLSIRELLLWALGRRDRLRVVGRSMLPLLNPGEEVLVDPRAYRSCWPEPGAVVVVQHPQQVLKLVKRVVAVRENGACLVSGDNPAESSDSRQFGAVPPELILGQVTCRFG